MESIKGSLALTGKLAFIVISRVIGFTLFGAALNIVLLALSAPEFISIIGGDGGSPAVRTGIGAVLVLMQAYINHPVLMFLFTALLLFPIVYLVLGKKHGLMLALNAAMKNKQEQWINAFAEKLVPAFELQSGIATSVSSLKHLLHGLSDQPWPQGWIIQHLIKKLNLTKILDEVASRKNAGPVNDRAPLIAAVVSRMLDERIGKPGLNWFFLLLAVNVGSFAALKILY